MKEIYFDLQSGAAGDMLCSALLQLTENPSAELTKVLKWGWPEKVELSLVEEKRSEIICYRLAVTLEESHIHRNLGDINAVISGLEVSSQVKKNSKKVFLKLAEIEAKVHGTELDKVHFHEVGALDSILDTVLFCHLLEVLGSPDLVFSEFYFGKGKQDIAHGKVPVPVPAVSKLTDGYHCRVTEAAGEIITPTAACLLTVLGRQQLSYQGRKIKTSWSCGTRKIEGIPGYLSATLIEVS